VNEHPLGIVFAGTPQFAATHLEALLASTHRVLAVYTQPDRPAGRGKRLQASPVKQLGLENGLDIYQPASLKGPEERDRLAALRADVLVVVAYGLILPQGILDCPRLGCLNVHASLLPRWRGAAPIQRAIEAGDSRSGVTIMQMDAGLDTGAVLATADCPIGPGTSAAELQDQLATLGAPLLLRVLDALPAFQAAATAQPASGATYAEKILKSEAEIDWHRDATELQQLVHAFNPFPVCYTLLAGERVKLWECAAQAGVIPEVAPGTILASGREGVLVQCGSGQLRLTRLQLPGGKPLAAAQLLNARAADFAPGVRLGNAAGKPG
jgi:methionyl-tRNA formyltransferase